MDPAGTGYVEYVVHVPFIAKTGPNVKHYFAKVELFKTSNIAISEDSELCLAGKFLGGSGNRMAVTKSLEFFSWAAPPHNP
jgi:hypothetical protein